MMPMVALTPESGDRPMASTTWPGFSVSVEPKVAAGAPFSASFQHGEIGAGIAARQSGGSGAAVRQRDADFVAPANGVLGGDDDAGPPDDAARSEARPGIHGHHGAAGLLHGSGQFIG
jgi:hypothetical protein